MSSICLCITDIQDKNKLMYVQCNLEIISGKYGFGVSFSVNWTEPIIEYLKNRQIINLLDNAVSNNCEMLLLPDGWYHNRYTNGIPFKERMKFLQDVADFLVEMECTVEFYIGPSGMLPNEFLYATVKSHSLIEYLSATIGLEGATEGIHILIDP